MAPPDPVAATAVARKLRLPRRLQTILEGEGLSNDATSLVLYEVAVAATMTGALAPAKAAGSLGLAIVVGIGVGLVIAVVVRWLLTPTAPPIPRAADSSWSSRSPPMPPPTSPMAAA